MDKRFYRFRSVDKLLGFNELWSQQIYFSPLKDLNDPMEGFRDIYWKGDEVIWKNLFRNFLFCLNHILTLSSLSNQELKDSDIPVRAEFKKTLPGEAGEILKSAETTLFRYEYVNTIINGMAKRVSPIRRDELSMYLSLVYTAAFNTLMEEYVKRGVVRAKFETFDEVSFRHKDFNNIGWFEVVNKNNPVEQGLDYTVLTTGLRRTILNEMILLELCSKEDIENFQDNAHFIQTFNDHYVNALQSLIYPEAYVACFMSDFSNSSLWGHYAASHTGVCLIFKPDETESGYALPLNRISGGNGFRHSYSDVSHHFKEINYIEGVEEIDFFNSIGNMSQTDLISHWFVDGEIKSQYINRFHTDQDEWRDGYWNNYYKGILAKSKDWEYERESRLILSSTFFDFSEKESRLLPYKFTSLEGLIFGINTRLNDKVKIMKIIKSKLSKHPQHEFSFYQARYCNETKKVVADPMTTLNKVIRAN